MSDPLKLELQIAVVLGTEPSSPEEQYKLLSSEASLQPPPSLPPASLQHHPRAEMSFFTH